MPKDLPIFKYHPDPLGTGSIAPSDNPCECCGLTRGFLYTCNFYSLGSESAFCPWCIVSGKAATEFDGIFCDDFSLVDSGLPNTVIEEVTQRTPGFSSWQSEVWLTCCKDACEFHGDATVDEIKNLNAHQLLQLHEATGLSSATLQIMVENYIPASSPAFYKWKCRVCHRLKYFIDYS